MNRSDTMNRGKTENEYVGLMVNMYEKSNDELCAIAESGRIDDIMTGYLVLILHKVGVTMEKVNEIDYGAIFRKIDVREAQMLGRLYGRKAA
ncbi:hypothetical protein [Sporofaciens musculi]|uniref:hypothetical protein n=1 Tax=Sporofaciens musculi TaxID=2681861 RepID=UPI002170B471|nr:hypothetical protein [Sporofaciens musculi]MCI9423484.1 hypothetical protein [Dorea sp.]